MKKYQKNKFHMVIYDKINKTWIEKEPLEGDIYWVWEYRWKYLSYSKCHIEYKLISGMWIEQDK